MDEFATPHPDYLKGFNDGYLIAEHLPDLAEKLSHTTGNSLQLAGFKQGMEQYNLERNKEHTPAWLKDDRLSSLDKDDTKAKDKDTPDRE